MSLSWHTARPAAANHTRWARRATGAIGVAFQEGIQINQSLTALGSVLSQLSRGPCSSLSPRRHVSYRDSKLTRLLENTLGGNSKTLLIACISPAGEHKRASVSTPAQNQLLDPAIGQKPPQQPLSSEDSEEEESEPNSSSGAEVIEEPQPGPSSGADVVHEPEPQPGPSSEGSSNGGYRFAYTLAVPTSPMRKSTEEPLSAINHMESYGMKVEVLGNAECHRGKIMTSTIHIGFVDRPLHQAEDQLMRAWEEERPERRLIEIDATESKGISDVRQNFPVTNTAGFSWDPSQETEVFFKVNCVGTEFTQQHRGGPEGAIFRLTVNTQMAGSVQILHTAYCNVKIYRGRGAEYKRRQDWIKFHGLSDEKRQGQISPGDIGTAQKELPSC